MKSDSVIREDVLSELRWDPQVSDPDAIGVAVKDGAVTLTGRVPTYGQKLAAAASSGAELAPAAASRSLAARLRRPMASAAFS